MELSSLDAWLEKEGSRLAVRNNETNYSPTTITRTFKCYVIDDYSRCILAYAFAIRKFLFYQVTQSLKPRLMIPLRLRVLTTLSNLWLISLSPVFNVHFANEREKNRKFLTAGLAGLHVSIFYYRSERFFFIFVFLDFLTISSMFSLLLSLSSLSLLSLSFFLSPLSLSFSLSLLLSLSLSSLSAFLSFHSRLPSRFVKCSRLC